MPIKYIAIFLAQALLIGTAYAADITAPVTINTQTPNTPDGKNGWYVSPVKFDLQSTDLESGIKRIHYRVDNGMWQQFSFENNLNLAPDPSFEDQNGSWSGSFSYVYDVYDPAFPTTSARIVSTEEGWHGINHAGNFAVTTPLSNMTASVSLKTENVADSAHFKVYSVSTDGEGNNINTLISQSSSVTGTTDWAKLNLNFVVNDQNSIGVFLDIGINGTGTVWVDAVSLSNATKSATGTFTVAKDSSGHVVEYYSIDFAGNTEAIHTVNFKQDMTPPGNWHNSGAFRGIVGPSNHHLYSYTEVDDETSGISGLTDRFQYKTDNNPGFGTFSDLMQCSSTWNPSTWADLSPPTFSPGDSTAYLLTPKTDFCDSNWKICKTVRFQAEDLAGNTSTKDMCINGPWIKLRGEGAVRANYIIDMLSEANEANTDSLIETGGNTINFFTSVYDWKAKNSKNPSANNYDSYLQLAGSTTLTATLPTTSGKYLYNGNLTLNNTNIPGSYDNNEFDQVIFVNGNLTINDDLEIQSRSTALFIVKGNVNIDKKVENIRAAFIADGDMNTAYNINEGEQSKTLNLRGIYHANKFVFLRTLQGTNNSDTPSEDFTFEPKYLVQLKNLFGESKVKWLSVE